MNTPTADRAEAWVNDRQRQAQDAELARVNRAVEELLRENAALKVRLAAALERERAGRPQRRFDLWAGAWLALWTLTRRQGR